MGATMIHRNALLDIPTIVQQSEAADSYLDRPVLENSSLAHDKSNNFDPKEPVASATEPHDSLAMRHLTRNKNTESDDQDATLVKRVAWT